MAGPANHNPHTAPLSVVLVARQWNNTASGWVREWLHQSASVELIVVDLSPNTDLVTKVPTEVKVVEGHRGTVSMALNAGLEAATGDKVLFQSEPRCPPEQFLPLVEAVRAPADAMLMGPGAPPAGMAQSALDTLMLHLVSGDAVHQAPTRWPNVPGSLWVLFPTAQLRALGGLEAVEEHFELAIQDACLRLSRHHSPVRVDRIQWSVNRRTMRALADDIRGLTAARIARLARRPDSPLEPGWTFATRTALQTALERDHQGNDRQEILEQLGDLDLRPLARMPEWAIIARDQLRRLLVGLRQQQQRWVLEGLKQGLEQCGTDGIPTLLGRHPIRLSTETTVLLPVERPDATGLQETVASFFRSGVTRRCTLAVVAGPSTSARLQRALGSEWYGLQLMAALADSELLLHASSLTAPRALRMLAPCSAWVPVARLQGEAWALHAQVCGTRALRTDALAPWPIDVDRPVRLLSWPRWNDPEALRAFFRDVVVPVSRYPDITLCLRFDVEQDGSLDTARRTLDELSLAMLPREHHLELLLLSEPMPHDIPRRLGLQIHAWIGDSPSSTFLSAVGAPVFETPQPVVATWARIREQLQAWDAPTTQ
ncbi:MAG: hypothetical protein CL927_04615 [Deltaproteobacteria bacterium]|nr:hypothetical protein [Deltaproteobacteria bacterium]HCH63088.1 hypothetical protein [Deltaproteobacteria bacterium]